MGEIVNITADLIVEVAPCPKCKAQRGVRCGGKGRKRSHKERMFVAQVMVHAFNEAGENIGRCKISQKR